VRYIFILLAAALVLAGCGEAPTVAAPTPLPATSAPVPTQAPTQSAIIPTAVSTTPIVLAKTELGPRAVIQSYFERAPFSFTFANEVATDHGPAVRGKSKIGGIEIILTGPPNDITEAQMQIMLNQGASSSDAVRHMVALLEVAAPGISDPTTWLAPHLDRALKEGTDAAIDGDRTIMIIFSQDLKLILLSVQPGM
jgi:hypothetical protein